MRLSCNIEISKFVILLSELWTVLWHVGFMWNRYKVDRRCYLLLKVAMVAMH